MPPVALATFTTDRDVKTLSGDPDGCGFAFSPHPGIAFKFKAGAFAIIIDRRKATESFSPHYGKAFRLIFNLPGTSDKWTLTTNTTEKWVRERRADIGVTLELRASARFDTITLGVQFGQRPPINSLPFPVTVDAGVTLRVNAAGDLEFCSPHVMNPNYPEAPFYTMQKWVAIDSLGRSLGIAWRVAAGQPFIDLTAPDWDTAVYPVVVN